MVVLANSGLDGNLCICLLYLISTRAVLLSKTKAKSHRTMHTGRQIINSNEERLLLGAVCLFQFASKTTVAKPYTFPAVIHNLITQSVSTAAAHSTGQIHLKI